MRNFHKQLYSWTTAQIEQGSMADYIYVAICTHKHGLYACVYHTKEERKMFHWVPMKAVHLPVAAIMAAATLSTLGGALDCMNISLVVGSSGLAIKKSIKVGLGDLCCNITT